MAHTLVFRASPGHGSVLTDRQTNTDMDSQKTQLGSCLGKIGQKVHVDVFIKREQNIGFPLDPEPLRLWEHRNDSSRGNAHTVDVPLRTKPRWKSGSSAVHRRQKLSETWSDMRATSSRNSGGPSTTNITFLCVLSGTHCSVSLAGCGGKLGREWGGEE